MSYAEPSRRHISSRKFLRIAGLLWLGVLLAVVVGTLVAPHVGRIADVVLHVTIHRHWTLLTLHAEQLFVDLSTPAHAVKSYYSALYRGDTATMERLTAGPLRDQMRQRMAYAEAVPPNTRYRSYLHIEMSPPQQAVVTEKFHLFWQRGLRFHLAQNDAEWHLLGIMLVQ